MHLSVHRLAISSCALWRKDTYQARIGLLKSLNAERDSFHYTWGLLDHIS